MLSSDEILWLKIAIKKNYLTREQVEECREIQLQQSEASIRKIFIEKEYLDASKIQQITKLFTFLKQKQTPSPQVLAVQEEITEPKFEEVSIADEEPEFEEVSIADEEPEFEEIPTEKEEELSLPQSDLEEDSQIEESALLAAIPLTEELTEFVENPESSDNPVALEAIEILEESAQELPVLGREFYDEGLKQLAEKQVIRAMNLFEKAIEENPAFTEAYYQRGLIHYQFSELKEAIDCFSKAIEYSPEHSKILEARGNAYMDRGEKHKAEADYLKVIEFAPERQTELSERFYYQTGEKSEMQKIMLDLKLEVKKDDLNKKLKTQRNQLLQRKFETKKLAIVSEEIEKEKSKDRKEKVRAIDLASTLNRDLASDSKYVSFKDKKELQQTETAATIKAVTERQAKNLKKKLTEKESSKKRISISEEKFSTVAEVFQPQKKGFIAKLFKELLWLIPGSLLLLAVLYYYQKPAPTPPPLVYKINGTEYQLWEKTCTTFLEQHLEGKLTFSPRNLLDLATIATIYQQELTPHCERQQITFEKFLAICKALGQSQSYRQAKKQSELEIQKLDKAIENLEKEQKKLSIEAEKKRKSLSPSKEEEFTLKIEKMEIEISRQERFLATYFSKAKLDKTLTHNLKIYQQNQKNIENLWLKLLEKLKKKSKK